MPIADRPPAAFDLTVNGAPRQTTAATLADLITDLDLAGARVATAVNGVFVPATARATHPLAPADRVEILSPRQGG